MSLEYLVRNLLKLYVDIEFTGSHTQVIATLYSLLNIIVASFHVSFFCIFFTFVRYLDGCFFPSVLLNMPF